MGKRLTQNDIANSCLLCLEYFGIFNYPLTKEEVYQFNPARCTPEEIEDALNSLVRQDKVIRQDSYYLLEDNSDWITERRAGNERAKRLLSKTGKYASVIASFPFVDGIAISGSLSKQYASTSPDIDYFIITRANRLWIARSLLHLFKKLTFITGHQHFFCMNYFIDREALCIRHQNIYSAIEVNTLLPLLNKSLFEEFKKQNMWVNEYQPNHEGINNFSYLIKDRKRVVKSFWEFIFELLLPNNLNLFLMRFTDWKWRKKWRHSGYSPIEYDKAFLTELHVSKNHPMDYEKKVLESLSGQNKEGQP